MGSGTVINRNGMVMVSVTGLRRLLSNSNQSEMVEEMLSSVINNRLRQNGYRLAGIAADCKDLGDEEEAFCEGVIYLDRERLCDECGREVSAAEVVKWISEGIYNGTIVKSFSDMETEKFWNDIWAEFDSIENANAGDLARMVGS
jgi:hypothetical protein